jgi:hypothetical protein
MRSAIAERRIDEGNSMIDRRACEQNSDDAKESCARHLAPAHRAMKNIAQLNATAEPTKSRKQ